MDLDEEYESEHDNDWKRKNLEEINKEDDEIKALERKLGIRTDAKRSKRYYQRIEEEGLGLGIFDFLDNIDQKAKLDLEDYSKPAQEYKFNDPKFEVAIGESDVEGDGNQESSSDQEGFDEDGLEKQTKKPKKQRVSNLIRDDEEDYYKEGDSESDKNVLSQDGEDMDEMEEGELDMEDRVMMDESDMEEGELEMEEGEHEMENGHLSGEESSVEDMPEIMQRRDSESSIEDDLNSDGSVQMSDQDSDEENDRRMKLAQEQQSDSESSIEDDLNSEGRVSSQDDDIEARDRSVGSKSESRQV